jgi:hypothetical protein
VAGLAGKLGLKTRLLVEVRDDAYRVCCAMPGWRDAARAAGERAGDVTFHAGGVESDRLVIHSGEQPHARAGWRRNWMSISVAAPNLALLAPGLGGAIKDGLAARRPGAARRAHRMVGRGAALPGRCHRRA